MSDRKRNNDPDLLERVATLEADVAWLKRLTSVEILLLVATLISVLAGILK